MRFAPQLSSHVGTEANPQISGRRGLVVWLCPSRSWLSHLPRLTGNPSIALQCPNGERSLLKSPARSARGCPVLWGRGREEKPSRAPQGCGGRGRVPLQSLERSRSITRWCCNPLLQLPILQGSETLLHLICSAPRNTKPLAGAGQTDSLSSLLIFSLFRLNPSAA